MPAGVTIRRADGLAAFGGAYYLAGRTVGTDKHDDAVVLALSHSGAPVPSFGPDGVATLRELAPDTVFFAIATQGSKLVAAGEHSTAAGNGDAVIAVRFQP
jgi:hypothetical protein